jgi:hypothetical protein
MALESVQMIPDVFMPQLDYYCYLFGAVRGIKVMGYLWMVECTWVCPRDLVVQ